MGAWSHESFGNDDACDWIEELEESSNLAIVEFTLDAVLAIGGGYLEAPEASKAIAAAEAMARLLGNPGSVIYSDFGIRIGYSESVDAWVERVGMQPPAVLVAKAHRALERILTEPSELFKLWQESEKAKLWEAAVKELQQRISA